jgi:molecular chaperone GrpE
MNSTPLENPEGEPAIETSQAVASEPDSHETSVGDEPNDPRVTELEAVIQSLMDERDTLKDQALRAMADFQNFRRRAMAERERETLYANERFVLTLLPVLDNFERAVASLESGASVDSVLAGIASTERLLKSALESQRVSEIAAYQEPFDPELHEAISTDVTEEVADGTVTAVLEKGYRLGDRVIRPARVRVAKAP